MKPSPEDVISNVLVETVYDNDPSKTSRGRNDGTSNHAEQVTKKGGKDVVVGITGFWSDTGEVEERRRSSIPMANYLVWSKGSPVSSF